MVAARLNYREHVRLAMAFDATVAGLQGRFEDAAGLTAAAQALMAQRGYPAHAALAAFVQQVPVLWLRGGLGQALPACRAVVERDPSRPALRAVLSWVAAEAGETDEARTQLAAVDVGRFVAGEPAVDWWAALAACANAARIILDVDCAGVVHRALLPYADRNAVFGQVAFYGAVSHHLGVLSLVLGDDDGRGRPPRARPPTARGHGSRAVRGPDLRRAVDGAGQVSGTGYGRAGGGAAAAGGHDHHPARARPGGRPTGGQRPGRGVTAGWASRARTSWGKTSVAASLPIRASRWE